VLLLLLVGGQAYKTAKADGIWSWRLFFLVLLGIAVILGISIPLLIGSMNALKAGNSVSGIAGIVCAVLVMIVGIVVLALRTRPQKRPRS
jgi:hypothetical protein